MRSSTRWLVAIALGMFAGIVGSQPAAAQTVDLTKLSLEDLLNTEITSASRKAQKLSRTAAAVYVITREDIRRSGARTIPDVIRMAPGFSVGQIDASSWAISARGFNGLFANKLLVLIDGRSVYSPMLGGVYWDMQNIPLRSIDRIEVIRGPGGTLWGANAVNGIINIITTSPANATPGGAVDVSLGNLGQRATELRYASGLGENGHYRVYGKYAERGSGRPVRGLEDPDDTSVSLGDVRLNWRGELNTIDVHGMVQNGDGRHVRTRPTLSVPWVTAEIKPVSFTDGNVVLSWTRVNSSRSQTNLQTYYQNYRRTENGVHHHWHIGEIDVRQQQAVGQRHEFVVGLGYRYASSALVNSQRLAYLPEQEKANLFTGFVHDEIAITDNIHLTPGVKLDHNSYTGVELQPNFRATWTLSRQQALWAAVTRAVRTPARVDRGLRVLTAASPGFGGLPLVISVEGSPDFDSENLEAIEAGYRWQGRAASIDLTGFQNVYEGLRGTRPGVMRLGAYEDRTVRLFPQRFTNLVDAKAYGAELAATWQPIEWWRVNGSYAWLRLVPKSRGDAEIAPTMEGPVPKQQFHLRTYVDLPANIEASALLYGASAIDALAVEPYRRLDLHFAWRTSRPIELSFTVQNLLHNNQREFTDVAAPVTVPVHTSAFGEISWRF